MDVTKNYFLYVYHFTWAGQREKQGYKSDVSLKAGIHLVVSWENIPLILTYSNLQAMLYIGTTKPLSFVGLN